MGELGIWSPSNNALCDVDVCVLVATLDGGVVATRSVDWSKRPCILFFVQGSVVLKMGSKVFVAQDNVQRLLASGEYHADLKLHPVLQLEYI